MIGNFLAVGGQNRVENLPSASLRESEVGIQAIVDPYARADFFLSFGEEGVDVEEGFLTFTALPQSLLAKVGRMRASFGKVNTLHLHVLPWPDEPLPVVNLLGGEEGWIGTGVSDGAQREGQARLAPAISRSTSSPKATKPPACRSSWASERPARAAPAARGSVKTRACSGMNEVPSQPSAISPVISRLLGERVAR